MPALDPRPDPDRPPDLTSTANPRVKAVVRLRTRGGRTDSGRTLIEGHDELRLALAAGVVPDEVWWAPSLVRPEQLALLDALPGGVRVTSVTGPVFDKIAYRQSPDGWLAVAPTPGRALDELMLPASPLVLVGEGIEKPGNLGAMIRTAEALGVDAVISASAVTDFGNPNVVRASKGTIFAMPVAGAPSDEVLAWLRRRGLGIVVTTPQADIDLVGTDLAGPTALVVGAESTGVDARWLDAADVRVAIPMHGHVNSLNAATTAALVMYEARRQRDPGSSAGPNR